MPPPKEFFFLNLMSEIWGHK